jgi:hypothetical protein
MSDNQVSDILAQAFAAEGTGLLNAPFPQIGSIGVGICRDGRVFMTRRWREMDSNHRYPEREACFFPGVASVLRGRGRDIPAQQRAATQLDDDRLLIDDDLVNEPSNELCPFLG